MRFLVIQIVVVILVCIFIAALSNLTELGVVGWIIAGSTGHALYKVYKHMHYSYKTSSKRKCSYCSSEITASDFSRQVQSFMFDDVTSARDE